MFRLFLLVLSIETGYPQKKHDCLLSIPTYYILIILGLVALVFLIYFSVACSRQITLHFSFLICLKACKKVRSAMFQVQIYLTSTPPCPDWCRLNSKRTHESKMLGAKSKTGDRSFQLISSTNLTPLAFVVWGRQHNQAMSIPAPRRVRGEIRVIARHSPPDTNTKDSPRGGSICKCRFEVETACMRKGECFTSKWHAVYSIPDHPLHKTSAGAFQLK
jgi:hypothetical protein